MDKMPQTTTHAKRTFQWGISSTEIPFVQGRDIAGARDGSNCNDCSSYVSPLPRPKEDSAEPRQEGK